MCGVKDEEGSGERIEEEVKEKTFSEIFRETMKEKYDKEMEKGEYLLHTYSEYIALISCEWFMDNLTFYKYTVLLYTSVMLLYDTLCAIKIYYVVCAS